MLGPKSQIIIMSGKDSLSTRQIAKNISTYVQQAMKKGEEPLLTDLAYTLAFRRSRFPWIAAIPVTTLTNLAQRFDDSTLTISHAVKTPRIGLVFNGQGAQWLVSHHE